MNAFARYDAAMRDFDRKIDEVQRSLVRMSETEAAIAAERVAMARDLRTMLIGASLVVEA